MNDCFQFFSASLSWKTSSAILGRLSSPPSVRYSMPKVRAISLSAARPLATRALAFRCRHQTQARQGCAVNLQLYFYPRLCPLLNLLLSFFHRFISGSADSMLCLARLLWYPKVRRRTFCSTSLCAHIPANGFGCRPCCPRRPYNRGRLCRGWQCPAQ